MNDFDFDVQSVDFSGIVDFDPTFSNELDIGGGCGACAACCCMVVGGPSAYNNCAPITVNIFFCR